MSVRSARSFVGAFSDRAADLNPAQLAATLGSDRVTFGGIRDRSRRTAHALRGMGVIPGDRLAWWTDTSLRSLDLYVAAAKVGVAFCPLNPTLGAVEMGEILQYLNPRVLLSDVIHQDAAEAVGKDLGIPVYTADAGGRSWQHQNGTVTGAPTGGQDALGGPEDPHVIFLTSGSTGRPKGVAISQRATVLRVNRRAMARRAAGLGGEVTMFPLFHMAGWQAVLSSWAMCKPVHLVSRADPDELLHNICHWAATNMYCIPAVWRRILDCPRSYNTSSLEQIYTGTSRTSLELLTELRQQFPGSSLTVGYGCTELGAISTLPHDNVFSRPGTVGRPVEGVDVRIADNDELLARADTAMLGYHDLPAETAAAVQDGWYHTGDIATKDDDGFITIEGRLKELIRSGGEFIAPVEVEQAVLAYPGIRDVAVVGVPDDQWGEVVYAVVVPDGPEVRLADLRSHLTGRLAAFKHPRRLAHSQLLPRTAATGQVQRALLRQQILDGKLI